MPRVQVRFADGPVGMKSDRVGIRLNRSPEVRDEVIRVVDRFRLADDGTTEKRRQRTGERLDEVIRIAK